MEMAAVPAARTFAEIGDTARTLVEALDDVVWSVDPRQDDLASVERRLREFAAEVLGAAGVRWTIHGAAGLDRWWLDPASRRHLLLVLKEGVTNIARHAGHAPRAIREAVQALIGGTPPQRRPDAEDPTGLG